MTNRTMGDAIHDNVAHLPAGLEMVAGYVTGSPDIQWTAADWARFPAAVHVTIDQGYTGSPVTSAMVRDVETGAWSPVNAVNRAGWTAPRPTIYCNRNDLSRQGGVLQSGWKGDLWLAWPGWTNEALPSAPGCNYVAVQNVFGTSAAPFDLSVVLDPTWPGGLPVTTPAYQLPATYSATPYHDVALGWAPSPNAVAGTMYHYQAEDGAGRVVADGRTAATSVRITGLPTAPTTWRVAVGADAGHLASPWSPWQAV